MSISLDLVRSHLKADLEDVESDLVKQYLASATSMCESYCNRKFYETEQQREDDFPVALQGITELTTTRDNQLETVTTCEQRELVWDRFRAGVDGMKKRTNGIVTDDTIVAAILLTAGFLYVNRAAPELPMAAKRILEPYQWIGDLAWT
jgi:hypothetical protein